MATIKLKKYRLEGGGWPNNAAISFRLVSTPIGPNLASSPVNTWNNAKPNSKRNFNTTAFLTIFVNNTPEATFPGFVIPVPTSNTVQVNVSTAYGTARLRYDVL